MHGLAEIDVALAAHPEQDWLELAGPVLLARHRVRIGLDERRGRRRRPPRPVRRSRSGRSVEGADPEGPASPTGGGARLARASLALADAIRADVARAVAGACHGSNRCSGAWPRPTRTSDAPGAVLRRPVRARRRRGRPGWPYPRAGPGGLLVLAFASQASISIFQWGGGALAPGLPRALRPVRGRDRALLGATSAGNAVALSLAGSLVDRSGAREPLMWAGSSAVDC